jgi:hypothetical protein
VKLCACRQRRHDDVFFGGCIENRQLLSRLLIEYLFFSFISLKYLALKNGMSFLFIPVAEVSDSFNVMAFNSFGFISKAQGLL